MLIYELYIDKFSANITGLIDKLEYLKDLGMGAIWILPHYPSPLVDDGYDVSDYKNVRTDLGTINDFKNLVIKAHELKLKIIIDLPLNHTSTDHAWFKEARSSIDNPKRDYYIWSKSGADMLTAVNAFPNAKLTNWIYNPFTNDYYYATFYPLQPDLNWDNPQVIEEFFEIIDFWMDLGVDGIRLDAVTHLTKRKHSISLALPETHNIVKAIRKHVDSKYKNKMIIGEADLPTRHAVDYFGQNDECNMLFDFEGSLYLWLYLLTNDIKYKNLITEQNDSKNSFIYFLGTHDALPLPVISVEWQTKLRALLDPSKKYNDKHDKRIAKRVAEIFKEDMDKIVEVYREFLKLPGHKVIYYGDEIGTTNIKTDEFLIDNRHEIRGNFDWVTQVKQSQDTSSIFCKLKALFVSQGV